MLRCVTIICQNDKYNKGDICCAECEHRDIHCSRIYYGCDFSPLSCGFAYESEDVSINENKDN